jgi:hypothetical protein
MKVKKRRRGYVEISERLYQNLLRDRTALLLGVTREQLDKALKEMLKKMSKQAKQS